MFRKIIHVLSRLNLIPIFIGLLFTTMHWPGDTPLLLVFSTTLVILHILKFFLSLKKETSDYLKVTAVVVFALFIFLDIFGYSISNTFDILYKIIIAGYFITKHQFEKAPFKQNIIAVILFWLSAFMLGTGHCFKIMHWPGTSALILLGTLIAIFWTIASLFNKKEKTNINDEIDTIGQS